ncbi:MAG: ABC transporter permease, partial [Tissierellia bacterium]|nr:ABC transporter permease [Tissierellia bacterium]
LQRDILNQYLYSISKVEGVILIVSTLLAMVVLFNLTNINIAERSREISTIKVLGFYPKETTKYIYRETGILTLMGIFIGLFAGKILHYVILQIVVPLEAMLLPHLAFNAYVRSALITAAVSICVMLYFHFKINRIDMVESLKGNE